MFDVFWVVLGGGFLVSGFHCVCVCARARACVCVCVRAWLGEDRKNILTNVKECKEGKLIWCVALFEGSE